ncbi:hypothetical protein DAEQUDRAFT_740611 [Daedalea quercina L-15889]|uniref:Uncharacterized protein n=1 Tax=Daedalea quercina L-15889 TaxID=1314783 RepID=A0A165MD91_9APHY|nr:hypothetical protein DAEQUDRAFT_740611 [Daedalea quercina L-15889]
MRTPFLFHCVLLLTSAASVFARPIYSGTVETSIGQSSYTVRAEHDHSHPPHTQTGTHGHHDYRLQPTRTSAGGHSADQRPGHHHVALVSDGGFLQGELQKQEAVRELPARFMYAHDIFNAPGHSIRAVEEIELLSRRLEARKKKEPKKPSSPPPKQSSSPQIPSKPKTKHHVSGKIVGKLAKGIISAFKFRLRELEGEDQLVAREVVTERGLPL